MYNKTILVALMVFTSAVAAGETVTLTGTSTTVATKTLMPMVRDGDTVVIGTNDGYAAVSTNPPSLMQIRCSMLGMVGATNEEYHADFYCALRDLEGNGIDLKGEDRANGGEVTVLGGSGKYQGATGSGSFKRLAGTLTESHSTFELNLELP